MADARADRAAARGALLAALLATGALLAVPVRGTAQEAPAEKAASAPAGGETATRVLVLPSIRAADTGEVSPWTSPAAAAGFERMEAALALALGEAGYAVSGSAVALAGSDGRAALSEAGVPLTPASAAKVARAAGAEVALVVRAQAIRSRGRGASALHTTDALVEASAYRARDATWLARTTTRVSGTGKDKAEADAEALARAAPTLAAELGPPLTTALGRPVLASRTLAITLEGSLNWREYRRVLDVILREIPEMEGLEERRFSRGRFTLLARCRCKAGDAARRLDGLQRAGFQLAARPEEGGFRLQVAPVAVSREVPAGGISP
ncbi:MAG: hypothetical protein ACE5FC_01040 [Myxococcota bacterium]